MTRRLIYLGVFVALAIGADVAARGFVEAAVSSRAQERSPEGSRVSASIRGFPFIPRLVLGGEISHAGVRVRNLVAGRLVFAEVRLDLDGVRFDRGKLFNDRKARITDVNHGTMTAEVTEDALSQALGGVPVVMTDTRIAVTIAGQDVPVTPRVSANGRLSLSGAGADVGFVLPTSDYIPCVSNVAVSEGRMRLSCEFDDVPPAFVEVVQDVSV